MKILVTGGAGFIGASLVARLAALPEVEVVAVDSLRTGRRDNLCPAANVHFVKADVNDLHSLAAIMTSNSFDVVFHYAALVGVARTLAHPTEVLDDIQGIRSVLELSKNTGVQRVFFSSSSEVYGEPVEMPQHEMRTPLNARLPYAVVKSIGECFCRAYHQEHGLPFTILRFFNTYGPLQNEDFVISRFLNLALRNEDITIYGDGQQTRTFCYIDDNLDFTVKILQQGLFANETVNVGHAKQVTINELAESIVELTNSHSRIVHLPALEEGDMRRRQPDNARMLATLGRELIDVQEGLRRMLTLRQQNSAD